MTSQRQWKQKMLEARKLRGKTAGIVWQRVKLLVEVFDDQDYRSDNGDLDDMAAAEKLSGELGDVAADFFMLRRVLDRMPLKSDWEGKDLRKMIAEVRELDKKDDNKEPRSPRRTATVKQLDGVQQERDVAEKRLTIAESTLAELRSENRQLREELAVARGRIEELEKALNRELVASGV